MIAFINASPLIFLSKINQLPLLKKLFTEIITIEHVKTEVLITKNQIGYVELNKFFESEIIVKNPIQTEFLNNLLQFSSLHIGEASLIALILETQNSKELAVLDDKTARKIARTLNVKVIGTIGVLLLGLKRSLLTQDQTKQSLVELVTNFNFRINTETYIELLKVIENIKVAQSF